MITIAGLNIILAVFIGALYEIGKNQHGIDY